MTALILKLKKLVLGNNEYDGLFKSASYSMLIKLLAIGATFLMNIVFSRALGAEGIGEFFLVLGLVTILSTIGKLGFDRPVLRYVAAFASKNEWGKVKAVQRFAFSTVGLCTLGASAVLFFLAPFLADKAFHQPGLAFNIQLFSIAIAPLSVIQNTGESLKGIGRVQLSQFLYDATLPLLVVLIFFLWPYKTGASAIYAYIIAAVIVFFTTQVAWVTSLKKYKPVIVEINKKEIWQSAFPVFLTTLFQLVITWMPTLLMGIWSTNENIGIYEVARRIAQLVTLFQIVMYSNLAPRISAMYVKGQIYEIEKICIKSTKFIVALSSPIILAFILLPQFFMDLFGDDFKGGGLLLTILALGQLINVITGPAGVTLMMCGREKKMRNNALISSVSLLVLSVILIPKMGALGAAISTASVIMIQNSIAAIYLYRELGIVALPYLNRLIKKPRDL